MIHKGLHYYYTPKRVCQDDVCACVEGGGGTSPLVSLVGAVVIMIGEREREGISREHIVVAISGDGVR